MKVYQVGHTISFVEGPALVKLRELGLPRHSVQGRILAHAETKDAAVTRLRAAGIHIDKRELRIAMGDDVEALLEERVLQEHGVAIYTRAVQKNPIIAVDVHGVATHVATWHFNEIERRTYAEMEPAS